MPPKRSTRKRSKSDVSEASQGSQEAADAVAADEETNTRSKRTRKGSKTNEDEEEEKEEVVEEQVEDVKTESTEVADHKEEDTTEAATAESETATVNESTETTEKEQEETTVSTETASTINHPSLLPGMSAPLMYSDEIVAVESEDGLSTTVDVPEFRVGAVIGAKGSVISQLQQRTGAKIVLNQDFPTGQPRKMTISGANSGIVKGCVDLVSKVIREGAQAIHVNVLAGGEQQNRVIECPKELVGRVIGSGGQNVKDIQSRTGCKIQIIQDQPEGVPRQVILSGTKVSVDQAEALVKYVMENGPVLPPATGNGTNYGPGSSSMAGMGSGNPNEVKVELQAQKQFIGRVIGKGGETIKALMQCTACNIKVEQGPEDPCKVFIVGAEAQVQQAIQLVQQILVDGAGEFLKGLRGGQMGMNPYGGGMGGMMGASPYGGGMPGQMMGGMGMPGMMPGMQPQMGMYGQPQAGMYGGGAQGGAYGPGAGMQQQYGAPQGAMMGGMPGMMPQVAQPPMGLPPGWAEYTDDKSGKKYYHHAASNKTQWEKPM